MKYSDLTKKDKIACALFIYAIVIASAFIIGMVCRIVELLIN